MSESVRGTPAVAGAPLREREARGAPFARLRALLDGGAAPRAERSGLRRRLAGVPRAAWACALVALANGLAWSLIVPPFQVPDENAHYAYVQQLAERGTLPHSSTLPGLSPREDQMVAALLAYGVLGHRDNPAPDTEAQQRAIEATAEEKLSARGSGYALSATSNPPLYYALQVVPYELAGERVLDKLVAMRVLSALLGAATALLVFLFLRELLPASPWAWSVGGLMVALQPLLGFMSGGVNNDDLLYPLAAGVLWALARAFRCGLDPGGGVLLGAFVGAGLVSKFTLLGFVPAGLLALVLLVRRARPESRRRALRGAAWALALGTGPIVVYLLLDHFVWRRGGIPTGVGSAGVAVGRRFSLREELSHIWQLFLPRLWMRSQFGYFPLWEMWFKGFVGRFGWVDYDFPGWVYSVALGVSLAVCALAAGELARRREALRRRLGELAVYALVVLGLVVAIGVQSYRFLVAGGGVFEQARYLLPLLGLYAAIVALAVRFAGRRWGPVVGAALVLLALGHDLYAQAITIARYYA
jgi:4-amino-4-deoxy-L-arabinose transferase-like glycosyltransferase